MGLFNNLFKKNTVTKDFPPKPKWKPNTPVDINLIMKSVKYYTDERIQIAIMKYGTVILFPDRVENIKTEAKNTLEKIYNSHPDFNPKTMDDGNYLIEYNHPAFTIVFKSEIDNHWSYIEENHLDGVCRDEVLINNNGERNVFNKIGKICLYGRSKMFMDAQEPEVAMTFNSVVK